MAGNISRMFSMTCKKYKLSRGHQTMTTCVAVKKDSTAFSKSRFKHH